MLHSLPHPSPSPPVTTVKLCISMNLRRGQWHPTPSTLAWKIPWMEEPGRLQSMGSIRVGHNWATSLSLFTFMHWRRKWQPTPVFFPGESLLSMGSHRVGHDWSDFAMNLTIPGTSNKWNHMICYNMCSFVSGLFYLAWFKLPPCCRMCQFLSFQRLNHNPLFVYATFGHPSIHPSIDIRVVFTFGLVWMIQTSVLSPSVHFLCVYTPKWN